MVQQQETHTHTSFYRQLNHTTRDVTIHTPWIPPWSILAGFFSARGTDGTRQRALLPKMFTFRLGGLCYRCFREGNIFALLRTSIFLKQWVTPGKPSPRGMYPRHLALGWATSATCGVSAKAYVPAQRAAVVSARVVCWAGRVPEQLLHYPTSISNKQPGHLQGHPVGWSELSPLCSTLQWNLCLAH